MQLAGARARAGAGAGACSGLLVKSELLYRPRENRFDEKIYLKKKKIRCIDESTNLTVTSLT